MYQITQSSLASYLHRVFGEAVTIVGCQPLGGLANSDKGYGYGVPLLVEFQCTGIEPSPSRHVVLHTLHPAPFGHEHRADRAAELLWSFDAFNRLPRHIRPLDVGAFASDREELISLGTADEFFLLTEYAEGKEYAFDLQRLKKTGDLTTRDLARADALCDYLIEIHQVTGGEDSLYARRIRELIGSGECVMGLIDNYPIDDEVFTPKVLQQLEQKLIPWRWRLKHRKHRLRQVHGDFHPWNILFSSDSDFKLLDRSRGEWGDPADDAASLTMNYLFESLLAHGKIQGPFAILFDRFWKRYLAGSNDVEILDVVAPFFLFRALVMASPMWFPNVNDDVRRQLLAFSNSLLDNKSFDFERIEEHTRFEA